MPRPDVPRVPGLAVGRRALAEVPAVAGGIAGLVVVIAGDRELGAVLDPAPGRVVAVAVLGRRALGVGVVAEGEHDALVAGDEPGRLLVEVVVAGGDVAGPDEDRIGRRLLGGRDRRRCLGRCRRGGGATGARPPGPRSPMPRPVATHRRCSTSAATGGRRRAAPRRRWSPRPRRRRSAGHCAPARSCDGVPPCQAYGVGPGDASRAGRVSRRPPRPARARSVASPRSRAAGRSAPPRTRGSRSRAC